jgi:hypothetical protein
MAKSSSPLEIAPGTDPDTFSNGLHADGPIRNPKATGGRFGTN